jgi:hypothetical protein
MCVCAAQLCQQCFIPGVEPGVNIPLLSHLVGTSQGGQLLLQRGYGPSFLPALRGCLSRCFGTHAAMDV